MKKMRFGKKAAAWVLAAAMVLSVIPSSKLTMSAYAEEENGAQIQETVSEEVPETSEAENEAPEVEPENKSMTVSIVSSSNDIVTGTVLSAKVTLSGGEPVGNYNYQYQWYRVSSTGEEKIADATGASYVVTQSDLRKQLKVEISSDYCKTLCNDVTESRVKVKGNITISTDPAKRSKFWDGKPIEPEVTLGGEFTDADKTYVKYLYYTNGQAILLDNAPTDAGTYYVRAIIEGEDFVKAESSLVTVTIKKRPNEANEPSDLDWIHVTDDYQPGRKYILNTPIADPTENQLVISKELGIKVDDITFEWYKDDGTNLIDNTATDKQKDPSYNWNDSVELFSSYKLGDDDEYKRRPTDAGTYTLVAHVPTKARIILRTCTITQAPGTDDEEYYEPTLTGLCGDMLGLIKFPGNGWHWDPTIPNLILKAGSTVTVKGWYVPKDIHNYEEVESDVEVKVIHDFNLIDHVTRVSPKGKKAGKYEHYNCKNCGRYYNKNKKCVSAKSLIIPVIPSAKAVVMDSTVDVSQLITDGIKAFSSINVKDRDDNKKYLKKISYRKLHLYEKIEAGLPTEIPVIIEMKDAESNSGKKNYTVNIKVTPKITINKEAINGGSRYKYSFDYNFTGAEKVQVRVKNNNDSDLIYLLDRYVSSPRSNTDSYFSISANKLNEFNGRLTFDITVCYGGGKTITRTITK